MEQVNVAMGKALRGLLIFSSPCTDVGQDPAAHVHSLVQHLPCRAHDEDRGLYGQCEGFFLTSFGSRLW